MSATLPTTQQLRLDWQNNARWKGVTRTYQAEDVVRLRFIRRAKALGFSLDEIVELLKLNDGGGRRSAVRALAQKRLVEIEQKLVDFGRMRDTLRGLVHKCHGEGSLEGCPIIETVLGSKAASPIKVRDRRTS